MDDKPLVSVTVITYNSAKFVLETLESIRQQTYSNIELIISDDCSKDNTVELCQQWINEHGGRFVRSTIVTTPVNTGVAANFNRAIDNSNGEWIKGIAGDDLLLPTSVADYINYINDNDESKIVFGKSQQLITATKTIVHPKEDDDTLAFYELDSFDQFKVLLYKCVPKAPSAFVSKEIYNKIRYNESYKYMEDIPMWVNITKNNYKLFFLDKETVIYRVHESISNSNESLIGIRFTETCNLYSWNESLKYCREYNLPEAYNTIRQDIFIRDLAFALFRNKKNFFTLYLYAFVGKIVRRFVRFNMD